jgi:hypothetical protein
VDDYPVKVRIAYPRESSRGWAILTILTIKLWALIPHFIVLAILTLVMTIVYFIAQIAVLIRGQYPPGLFTFVTGVIRWGTRVSAFALSLTDRYPPFSLASEPDYPVDVEVEQPDTSSKLLAGLVLAFIVVGAALAIAIARNAPRSWSSSAWNWTINLRALLALPHSIIVGVLGIAVFIVWIIVQWVILFVARFPEGMHRFVSQWIGWAARVAAYSNGLTDRYPPFSLETIQARPGQPAAGATLAPPPAPLPPAPQPPAPQPPAPQPPAPASGGEWVDERFSSQGAGEERTTELPQVPPAESGEQLPAAPGGEPGETPPEPPGEEPEETPPDPPATGPTQPPTPPQAPPPPPVPH